MNRKCVGRRVQWEEMVNDELEEAESAWADHAWECHRLGLIKIEEEESPNFDVDNEDDWEEVRWFVFSALDLLRGNGFTYWEAQHRIPAVQQRAERRVRAARSEPLLQQPTDAWLLLKNQKY